MKYLPTEIEDDARPLLGQGEWDDPATPDDLARYFGYPSFKVWRICAEDWRKECTRVYARGYSETNWEAVASQMAANGDVEHTFVERWGCRTPTALFEAFLFWTLK